MFNRGLVLIGVLKNRAQNIQSFVFHPLYYPPEIKREIDHEIVNYVQ